MCAWLDVETLVWGWSFHYPVNTVMCFHENLRNGRQAGGMCAGGGALPVLTALPAGSHAVE